MSPQIGRIIVAEVLREIENKYNEKMFLTVEHKVIQVFPVA